MSPYWDIMTAYFKNNLALLSQQVADYSFMLSQTLLRSAGCVCGVHTNAAHRDVAEGPLVHTLHQHSYHGWMACSPSLLYFLIFI